jgi:hypothetical protein
MHSSFIALFVLMNTITKRFDTVATVHWFKKHFTTTTTVNQCGVSAAIPCYNSSNSTTTGTNSSKTRLFTSTKTSFQSRWISSSFSTTQNQNSKASPSIVPRRKRMARGGGGGGVGGVTNTRNTDRVDVGSGVLVEEDASSSTAVQDPETFASAANLFLNRVQDALEPMKAYNEVFQVVRSRNQEGENLTIRLKPSEGQYVFQVHDDMTRLTMISPMSGSFTYVLCSRTGQFVGMDDGHICEGMLVRDLIRHCNGLPQF